MLLGCIMDLLPLLTLDFDARCGTCEQGLLVLNEAWKLWLSCCAGTMAWDSAPTAWPWAATAW